MRINNRKFIGMIIGVLSLIAIFTLASLFTPTAMASTVIITAMILVVTVIFMFVGGNVWTNWIKSKYFVAELAEKDEKEDSKEEE